MKRSNSLSHGLLFDLGYTLGGGVLTLELLEGSTTSVFTLTM